MTAQYLNFHRYFPGCALVLLLIIGCSSGTDTTTSSTTDSKARGASTSGPASASDVRRGTSEKAEQPSAPPIKPPQPPPVYTFQLDEAQLTRLRQQVAEHQPRTLTEQAETTSDQALFDTFRKRRREDQEQLYLGSFRRVGRRHDRWNAAAEEFITASVPLLQAGKAVKGETITALDEKGERLRGAGCDDPLVKLLNGFVLTHRGTPAEVEAADRLTNDAFKDLARQGYSERIQLVAALQRAQIIGKYLGAIGQQRGQYLIEAIPHFVKAATEVDDDPLTRRIVLEQLSKAIETDLLDQHVAIANALAADSKVDPWLRAMLIGRSRLRLAWNLRNNRPDNAMPPDQLAEFHERMREARIEFVRAWELDPQAPEAAAELIGVTMATGGLAGETTRFWFDESVRAQFDFPLAYERYLWSLRPRWGGSHARLLDFGRECLATGRFDLEIPWRFHNAVEYVREEISERDEIYTWDGIYESYEALISGYREIESKPGAKDWRDTQLACVAMLSGRRELASEILDRLGAQAVPGAALMFHTTLGGLRRGVTAESSETTFTTKTNPFGYVFRIAVREDGTRRIAAGDRAHIYVWELSGKSERKLLSDSRLGETRIALASDGSRLAHLASPNRVRIWNVDTATIVGEISLNGFVESIAFSPTADRIAIAGGLRTEQAFLGVWGTDSLQKELDIPRKSEVAFLLPTFSPEGTRLLFRSQTHVSARELESELALWDLKARTEAWRVPAPLNNELTGLAFAPDGSGIACVGSEIKGEPQKQRMYNRLKILDADSGREKSSFSIRDQFCNQLSFVDDSVAIAASTNGEMTAFDLSEGKELARYRGHGDLTWFALNPERTLLYSGGLEGLFEWPIDKNTWRSQLKDTDYRRWASYSPSSLRCSDDGRLLIAADINAGAAIWNLRHPEENRLFTVPYPARVTHASLSRDGQSLVGIVENSEARTSEAWIWDVDTGRIRRRLTGHAHSIRKALLTPDSRKLISASTDVDILIWDVQRGMPFSWGWLREHRGGISDMALSPDGKLMASASYDGTVRLWEIPEAPDDSQKGLISHTVLPGYGQDGPHLVFSPDGRCLAISAADSTEIWSTSEVRRLQVVPGAVACFTFDGRFLGTAGGTTLDTEARLWDVETGAERRRFQGGHSRTIQGLAFSPDGEVLITESVSSRLKSWSVQDGTEIPDETDTLADHWSERLGPTEAKAVPAMPQKPRDLEPRRTFRGHGSPVWCVTVSPDGRTVISGSGTVEGQSDNSLRVWDIVSGREKQKFSGHSSRALSVSIEPRGTRVVSGSQDGTVCLWDSASGELIREWSDPGAQIVRFAPSGKEFLAGGGGMVTLRSISAQEGFRLRPLANDVVWSASISPSGQKGLTCGGGEENTIRFWDLLAGRPLWKLTGHTGWVESVSFVGDENLAISGSHDGTLRLWDLPHARCLRVLTGHRGAVFCVAVSPTGRHVLSGGVDGILHLWNLDDDREVIRGRGHSADIRSVAFSPDGRTAVSGSVDGTVCVWDLPAAGAGEGE